MRRGLAGRAEVVDGADEPRAEEPVPGAVDDHPGRQRVVGVGQPVGQLATAALVAGHRRRLAERRHLEDAARDRLAEVVDTAADVDPRSSAISGSSTTDITMSRFGPSALQPLQFGLQRRVRSSPPRRRPGRRGPASASVGGQEDCTASAMTWPVVPSFGDQDEALAVLLEAVPAQRDEPAVDRRRGLHVDRHGRLAVGAEDRHRHGRRSVRCRGRRRGGPRTRRPRAGRAGR